MFSLFSSEECPLSYGYFTKLHCAYSVHNFRVNEQFSCHWAISLSLDDFRVLVRVSVTLSDFLLITPFSCR